MWNFESVHLMPAPAMIFKLIPAGTHGRNQGQMSSLGRFSTECSCLAGALLSRDVRFLDGAVGRHLIIRSL